VWGFKLITHEATAELSTQVTYTN